MAKKGWGVTFEIATWLAGTIPLIVVGTAAGVSEKVAGGKFWDGVADAAEELNGFAEATGRFGDQYNDDLTKLAFVVAQTAIESEIRKHNRGTRDVT